MSARSVCPVCRQPPVPEHAPFCSRGCKDRDLLRWLGDSYRLPGRPVGSSDRIPSADEATPAADD